MTSEADADSAPHLTWTQKYSKKGHAYKSSLSVQFLKQLARAGSINPMIATEITLDNEVLQH
jgi:hypothetical protein